MHSLVEAEEIASLVAMAPVFIKLEQLGIEPLGQDLAPPDSGSLVERIRTQAETIREQWQREQEDGAVEGEAAASRKESSTGA